MTHIVRGEALSWALAAVLLSTTGRAQALQFKTPAPEVTAAAAPWQVNNEPIVVAGLLYLPTREMRMFDGQVMTQIDVYGKVPVYADTTREPFTIVYVPISRDRMRSYERVPDRELAGPSGRGTPPLTTSIVPSPGGTIVEERSVGTSGTSAPAPSARPRPTAVESIPLPRGTNGVWIEFNGARWYADGEATSYVPERFTRIGQHRGFPVYRDKTSRRDRIWVAVVKDGPIAPFVRR
jgi:hypothetical protein